MSFKKSYFKTKNTFPWHKILILCYIFRCINLPRTILIMFCIGQVNIGLLKTFVAKTMLVGTPANQYIFPTGS